MLNKVIKEVSGLFTKEIRDKFKKIHKHGRFFEMLRTNIEIVNDIMNSKVDPESLDINEIEDETLATLSRK
jgi:hypothetical protein